MVSGSSAECRWQLDLSRTPQLVSASMRHPALQKSLLILALVLGQWLGFAHGFKHVDAAPAEAPCEMCLYAHGLDDALPPSAPATLARPGAVHEAPAAKAIACVVRLAAAAHPIRGPPVLLA